MNANKKLLLNISLFVLIVFTSVQVIEYVSFRILMSKNMLPPDGIIRSGIFSTKLSLYSGGLTNNNEGYAFRGFNDSLLPGKITYADQYGFLHGNADPIQLERPLNTIRIVLTGGSGMRGNLQTWSLIKMFNYPEGCYDYETSIAGKLKQILETKHPNIKWEVINAAVVLHHFHQSKAEYDEKIHNIHPDIIVNMDGSNDEYITRDFIGQGDPYVLTEGQATQGIDLEMLKRSARFGYTFMLLNHYLLSGKIQTAQELQIIPVIKKLKLKDINHLIKLSLASIDPNTPIIRDSFRLIDPFMRKNMQKLFWLIASYENQLKLDSVYSIFCFQPILARMDKQKKLSKKEQAIKDFLNADAPEEAIISTLDSNMHIVGNISPHLQAAFNYTGESRYFISSYNHKYFLNDYVSPTIDSIVRTYGGAYIDLGAKLVALSDSVEVYMDYTHTTPYGNQFIAEQIAKEISVYLDKKKLIK